VVEASEKVNIPLRRHSVPARMKKHRQSLPATNLFQCLMFRFYVGIAVIVEVTTDVMSPSNFVTLYGDHIQGFRITAKGLPWPGCPVAVGVLHATIGSQVVMVGDCENGIPQLPVKIDHPGRFLSPVGQVCMGVQIGFYCRSLVQSTCW
jgi:hypothetical protein